MDTPKNSDPQKSDEIKKENDEDIIELTNIVEMKSHPSLENEVTPDDLPDSEDNDVSDDVDMADLEVLVSEITGAPLPGSGMTATPIPGMENITLAQLDMAVDKAVDKLFKEKIEAKIMALFEGVVKKEIDKITELIKEEAKKD